MPLTTLGMANVLGLFTGIFDGLSLAQLPYWQYVSLHTGDPINGANEVVGNSYQRKLVSFEDLASATDEDLANDSSPGTWTVGAGENWGNLVHAALCSGGTKAVTSDVRVTGPITSDMTTPGNTFTLPTATGIRAFGSGNPYFTKTLHNILLGMFLEDRATRTPGFGPGNYYGFVADPTVIVGEPQYARRFLMRLYASWDRDTETGTEVSGTGYAEVPMIFDLIAKTSGNTKWVENDTIYQFPVAGVGGWGLVKYLVLFNDYVTAAGTSWASDSGGEEPYVVFPLGLAGSGFTIAENDRLTYPASTLKVYAQ